MADVQGDESRNDGKRTMGSMGGERSMGGAFLEAAEDEARLAKKSRQAMLDHVGSGKYSAEDFARADPGDWKHTTSRDDFTAAEVQIGKRCHGFHLELLRHQGPTPVSSHYVLTHYDVPVLDPATHAVQVRGHVHRELELTLSSVRRRESITTPVLMACAGIGRSQQQKRFWTHAPWGPDAIGCALWTGCSLADLLREVGVREGAKKVIFTGADKGVEGNRVQHFQRCLSIEEAMKGHVLVCWAMNGEDLSPAHGAPIRLIVPGWYGMASVKWLTSIEVTADASWWGYQMDAYSFKRTAEDPNAVPLTQLAVRALMAPPGFPDFVSRTRVVPPGVQEIVGKAWAGAAGLDRVEFSSDNGETWERAELEEKNGPFGWAAWKAKWNALEGETAVLCCRAFDCQGRGQDRLGTEIFNYASFGCTQPQQVYCRVDARIDTPGADIDLTSEQKAAKTALLQESGLSVEHAQALYQAPGSQ